MNNALCEGGEAVESTLKLSREKAGMTLEHAAKRLCISPGYLLQIETGRRSVGAPRANQIAELYRLRKDDLFVPVRFAARYSKGGTT